MPEISYNSLVVANNMFFNSLTRYPPFTIDWFTVLNNTGCRWIEVYEMTRWSNIGSDRFTVDTAKNSNNRTFLNTDLTFNFITWIDARIPFNYYFRYYKAQRIFNRHFYHYDLSIGNKQVSVHFWRYMYAKRLKLEGYKDDEIKDAMGEVSQANANLYIYATFESDIPPHP